MKFRIVIHFGSGPSAAKNIGRIAGVVALEKDEVRRGGHLVEVITEYPEKFIASYFEEGFLNTFTCQLEES